MRGIAPILGVALLVIATVTSAEAPPRPSSDPIASAFEALSPGNRRIARAIFTAQARAFIEPGATPLSLEQVAALRGGGQDWGRVFQQMKARGLVEDQTLGQAISRYNHAGRLSASRGGGRRPAAFRLGGHRAARSADASNPGGPGAARGDAVSHARSAGHDAGGAAGRSR